MVNDTHSRFVTVNESLQSTIYLPSLFGLLDFLRENYGNANLCKISSKPNKDGKYIVDCNDSLTVTNRECVSLTNNYFIFGTVTGHFNCSYCKNLTSFEGAPEKVGMDFACYHCLKLTSLKGGPTEVLGDFSCCYCPGLTSLKGAPEKVGGHFFCYQCNRLKTLEGAPEKVGMNFACCHCPKLTSLEGGPIYVEGNFDCSSCPKLTSPKGAPKYVKGYFYSIDNKNISIESIKKISSVGEQIIIS